MTKDKTHQKQETMGNEGEKSRVSSVASFVNFFSKNDHRSPIVFLIQAILIFAVVGASLINLSINRQQDENNNLWIVLLSSCVGYILPNPSIKLPRQ